MSFLAHKLSDDEIALVRECLRAAVEGPFFPEWEFETLIGVDRVIVARVYTTWPDISVEPAEFSCAVLGSLNNLLRYPHGKSDKLKHYITSGIENIQPTLDRLITLGL